MKLALSGRLFEAAGYPNGYRLARDEFLSFAKQAGYEGVELRYPQMPVDMPTADVAQVRARLRDLGLTWVYGTVEGLGDAAALQRAIATMKQHVAGGALFTRCTAYTIEHIPAVQRLADEAALLGATLIMQLHADTVADNVAHTVDALRRIDRQNVKLAYEPNHLVFDGDARYVEAIQTLAPHIAAVSVQNYAPAGAGAPPASRVKIGGREYVRTAPGDAGGIDWPAVCSGLIRAGFKGWVTVMCDCLPDAHPQILARCWLDYLRPLVNVRPQGEFRIC